MATDLYALWLIRDLVSDGRRWLEEAINAMGGVADAPLSRELVVALDDAGTLAWMMGNTEGGRSLPRGRHRRRRAPRDTASSKGTSSARLDPESRGRSGGRATAVSHGALDRP